MSEHIVKLPLGLVKIRLERTGLNLADRGGFEAEWVNKGLALSEESFLAIVKKYLKELYLQQQYKEPSAIMLNLAAHQLLDDLKGWCKLNATNQS
ncbi:MAG: hypothetical protein KC422_22415 [Trueperaceae bacterium]|nr:hypothetical protein [Trueperaceae bacterium]